MIRLLSIVFFLIIAFVTNAQQGFEKIWGTDLYDVVYDVIETKEQNLIICGEQFSFYGVTRDFFGFAYKFNAEGDSIVYKKFQDPVDSISILHSVKQITDSNFLLIGKKGHIQPPAMLLYNKIWILNVNQNLDTIWTKTIPLEDSNLMIENLFCVKKGNNFAILVGAWKYPLPHHLFFYYEIDTLGRIVKSNTHNTNFRGLIQDLIYNSNSKKFFLYSSASFLHQATEQAVYDSNFNFINVNSVNSFTAVYNGIPLNNSQHILNGVVDTGDRGIMTYIVDTNHQQNYHIIYKKSGVVNYPAYNKGASFIEKDKIFTGGTHRKSFAFFPTTPSYLLLSVVDSTLFNRWETLYGGDAYYEMESILATSDGGCLILASRYDYQTQVNEKDISIKKIFPPDSMPTNHIQKSILKNNYEIFLTPNPGNNELHIATNDFALEYEVEIRNKFGILLQKEKLIGGYKFINTQCLHKGMYFITLKNKDFNITKKWIKN